MTTAPQTEDSTEGSAPERVTDRLMSWIATAWYEHMFGHGHWHFGSAGEFRLATEEEYQSLGEDPGAVDVPLILARESDGAFFEVELDAAVWQTTAAERQERRERLAKMVARNERLQKAGWSS